MRDAGEHLEPFSDGFDIVVVDGGEEDDVADHGNPGWFLRTCGCSRGVARSRPQTEL